MQDATQDVAAEVISAEEVRCRRWSQSLCHLLFERLVRADRVRGDRAQDQQGDEAEADQGQAVTPQPMPDPPALGSVRSGTEYLDRGCRRDRLRDSQATLHI